MATLSRSPYSYQVINHKINLYMNQVIIISQPYINQVIIIRQPSMKSNIHSDPRTCMEACQIDLKCNFYKVSSLWEGFNQSLERLNWFIRMISMFQHYPSLEGRPEQCFFYDTCGKLVGITFYILHFTIVARWSADLHFTIYNVGKLG